jgi:DNA polymerase-1
MIETARRQGYVETISGRKRYLPDIRSANRNFRAAAERQAVNAPIQGTAADIIKRAMVALDGELERVGCRSRLILQVHDELLLETDPEELPWLASRVRAQMESAIRLDVPLRVEIKVGENWRDLDPYSA